jgi:hypothetical protein
MLVKTGYGFMEEKLTPDLVVEGLKNMVAAVRAAGKKVVMLAPPPANGMDIGECLERRGSSKFTFDAPTDCSLSFQSVKDYRADTFSLLTKTSELAHVNVVEIYDFLCSQNRCVTEIDGIPLYRDAGHLSVEGAKLIGSRSNLADQILAKAK